MSNVFSWPSTTRFLLPQKKDHVGSYYLLLLLQLIELPLLLSTIPTSTERANELSVDFWLLYSREESAVAQGQCSGLVTTRS